MPTTDPSGEQTATVEALKETLKKVEASLVPAVDSFCAATKGSDKEAVLPSAKGLDFLHAKNTLLLSYLIDLTVHLRDTVEESKEDESDDEHEEPTREQKQKQRRRLLEMRTVLDKSRGLDKKLRYQIEKLLSSLTDSSAFATGGEKDDGNDSDNSVDDEANGNQQDDPLRYRPDPKSMLNDDEGDESSDDDDDDDDDEDGDGSGDDMDEDDDLAAARATLSISKQSKSRTQTRTNNDDNDDEDFANKKYIAPRLTAVPYTHDVADKRSEKEKRQRRKLRATELAQTLRQQYGDQPETEDVFGGGNSELYGKQRSAQKALAQREAERTEFEESTMIRLTTSRKEKKEKKRIERMVEGGGNLAQMANLGNLVRETEAFGRDTTNDSDDDDHHREEAYQAFVNGDQTDQKSGGNSGRHANGKRRREKAGEKLKRPKAKNSLQEALYGGGSSGGGKGKKKSKR
jgi:hypothetical protein